MPEGSRQNKPLGPHHGSISRQKSAEQAVTAEAVPEKNTRHETLNPLL